MANGELHPEHLVLAGNKRLRPPPSYDVGLTGTRRGRGGRGGAFGGGRGRGRGAGGRNRGHGMNGSRGDITTSAQSRSQPQFQSQAQPSPLPTAKDTDPRSGAQRASIVELGSDADSDSGSDDDEAPEVLSARRPPGIDAYASSSDAELEPPQAVNTHSRPEPANPSSSGLATTAGPQLIPAKAESINRPRRAPPPQPKRPPRNPFAPRSSLLRDVSKI